MKKESQNQKCDPCEQQFEQNVHELVHEVEGYTEKEHRRKEKEVEASFGTSQPAAKH